MSRICAGTGDHLDAAYTLSALPMTFSAMIKLVTTAGAQQIINIGTSGSATNRYTLGCNAGFANCNHNDGTNGLAQVASSSPLDLGWHNISGVCASGSSRSALVDGINKATVAGAHTVLTPNAIRISNDLSGANPFKGLIAHVAIWAGIVSDADLAMLATVSPNMVRPDILIDYWPLQSNNASEPSYGSRGTVLTATGTIFSTDDPVMNAGVIQPMYYNRKQMFFV